MSVMCKPAIVGGPTTLYDLQTCQPDLSRSNSLTVINTDKSKKDKKAEYFFASDARY